MATTWDGDAIGRCAHELVSVVIPAHNSATTLSDTLDSLAEQSCDRLEVIVVDNASTDSTAALAARWGDRIGSLRVLNYVERRGPGPARSHGVESSGGTRLLFLDADDVAAPDYVHAMVNALDRHPFVHAAMDVRRLNPAWFADRSPGLGARTETVGHWKFAYGGTMGMTRALYDWVGGWSLDPRDSEDTELCWRIRAAGVEVEVVPQAVVHRRERTTARSAWRRGRWYGGMQARTNRRWRPLGLPVESERTMVPRAIALAKEFRGLRDPHNRVFWLMEAGIVSSRVQRNVADATRARRGRLPAPIVRVDPFPLSRQNDEHGGPVLSESGTI